MKTCPACDSPLEHADAAFCTQCGAKLGAASVEVNEDTAAEEVEAEAETPGTGSVSGIESATDALDVPDLPDVPADGDLADDGLPIAMAFNESVFLIEGCTGLMECRVKALGGEPVEQVSVSLGSDALGEVLSAPLAKLRPGGERVVHFQVTPSAVGTHHLTASVVYEHAGHVHVAVGYHRVTVLERNASPASIQIHYENRVEASDNAVVSNRAGNLSGLDKLIASGQASVNDVLSQQATLAPSWLALDLEVDDALTRELRRRRRDIVRPVRFHDDTTTPADRMGLVSSGLLAGDDDPRLSAQVFASLPIGFGRSSQSSEVVLRVLPRGEANDEASRMISGSRPHLLLRWEVDGPVLDDPGSANGTWVGGHRLETPMPLDPAAPSRIDIAHVLSLQLTPVAGEVEPERYERLGGQDALWAWGEAHAISSIRIEFIEARGAEVARPPVFLPVRWVDLVEDAHAGLTAVAHAGRSPAVRIVRTGDGLWAEACIDGITINGEALARSSAVPLAVGDTLASGGFSTRCEPFVQHLG